MAVCTESCATHVQGPQALPDSVAQLHETKEAEAPGACRIYTKEAMAFEGMTSEVRCDCTGHAAVAVLAAVEALGVVRKKANEAEMQDCIDRIGARRVHTGGRLVPLCRARRYDRWCARSTVK